MIDFDSIYKKIIVELSDQTLGLLRLYKVVLEICNNNEDLATAFLTSAKGGYTEKEINQIKNKIDYNVKYVQK